MQLLLENKVQAFDALNVVQRLAKLSARGIGRRAQFWVENVRMA